MRQDKVVQTGASPAPLPAARLLTLLGLGALFSSYLLVFALTRGEPFPTTLWRAAYNVFPAIPLIFGAHALLRTQVWHRSLVVVIAVQVPLALAFSFGWYLGIIVMRDLPSGWVQNGFIVRPFVPIALIWQLFQGLLLYTVVAMASLAAELAARVRVQEALFGKSERVTATNLIVKEGSEHSSVGFDEIIRVSGADEYIEVVLAERSILTTSSLAQIEARLPENLFFRAHRSHIVRFGAIVRSEPAGNGRTTLHLVNGNSVITSRSGTRLLRESAI